MFCYEIESLSRAESDSSTQLVLDFGFLVYMHLRKCASVEFSCFRGEI